MNQNDLRNKLNQDTPHVPSTFDAAMRRSLASIVAEEGARETEQAHIPHSFRKRRMIVILLVIALLISAAAVAARQFHIFDAIFGKTPATVDQVMQADLYQTIVNDVEITVKEAGYDGRTLYLLYTYRMLDVSEPLGEMPGDDDMDGVSQKALDLLDEHNVGWWIDHIWFDGRCMDMPANSGGVIRASDTPGELVKYEYWRLDNEGTALSGKVEISLPIGERQELSAYRRDEHPERYDGNGNLLLPDKGMITFTLDTGDMLRQVVEEQPELEAKLPDLTAKVVNVAYTPIMMYITLDLKVNQDAMDAFIAENGEGFLDDKGALLFPFGGMDVFGAWVSQLYLVDGEGNDVFPQMQSENGYFYGCNGYGNDRAEYLFPYAESYPDEMWLAPRDDSGALDMSLAVKVR